MHRCQEGTGSVRFVSVPDFSKIHRFGSVCFGYLCFPVRRGSACVFRTRLGSVRFGSVPRPGPAGSRINRFGSVRPVRFGILFLPEDDTQMWCRLSTHLCILDCVLRRILREFRQGGVSTFVVLPCATAKRVL